MRLPRLSGRGEASRFASRPLPRHSTTGTGAWNERAQHRDFICNLAGQKAKRADAPGEPVPSGAMQHYAPDRLLIGLRPCAIKPATTLATTSPEPEVPTRRWPRERGGLDFATRFVCFQHDLRAATDSTEGRRFSCRGARHLTSW